MRPWCLGENGSRKPTVRYVSVSTGFRANETENGCRNVSGCINFSCKGHLFLVFRYSIFLSMGGASFSMIRCRPKTCTISIMEISVATRTPGWNWLQETNRTLRFGVDRFPCQKMKPKTVSEMCLDALVFHVRNICFWYFAKASFSVWVMQGFLWLGVVPKRVR